MKKRNSILTETIISKDTFKEFENIPGKNKNINIQSRNIEFRASYTPLPTLNYQYSSKNTILTNENAVFVRRGGSYPKKLHYFLNAL